MSRKKIELYNFEKYQPHLPDPSIDRIEGNADEMVLSADGFEHSASDGVAGSMTINANGGVWIDTGPGVTCDVSSRAVVTTDTTSSGNYTILQYTKSVFRTAQIRAVVQSGNDFILNNIDIIHNDSVINMRADTSLAAPDNTTVQPVYNAVIAGESIKLNISGVAANTVVSCSIRYTL